MPDKFAVISFFALAIALVWWFSMRFDPHKGYTKVLERSAAGFVLCLLCWFLLSPLGITVPRTLFSALLAGYLGFPGVAFSTFLSSLP